MYAALFTSLLPCFVTNDVYILGGSYSAGWGWRDLCTVGLSRSSLQSLEGRARQCLAVGGMGLPYSV